MDLSKTRIVDLLGGNPTRREAARARVRNALACEGLEGRQLLSSMWPGVPGGMGAPPADFAGPHPSGAHNITPSTLTAAEKAAFTALQTDEQQLQKDLKADPTVTSLTAAVKADQAAVEKALGTTEKNWTAPKHGVKGFIKGNDPSIATHFKGMPAPGGPGGPGFGPGGRFGPGGPDLANGGTLPAALVTKLEAAGITATQISTFETDATNLRAAIKAVDPTVQADIAAQQKILASSLPAPKAHFDHIKAPDNGTTGTTAAATTTTPGA